MINENILGKCFRSSLSCQDLRISPLPWQYKCPRLFLLIITALPRPGFSRSAGPPPLFHALLFNAKTRFEHSNLLKVNSPSRKFDTIKCKQSKRCSHGLNSLRTRAVCTTRAGFVLGQPIKDPTMSFLNAATFVYACRGWYYRGCWHQTCPLLDPQLVC